MKPLLSEDDIFPLVAVVPFVDHDFRQGEISLGDVITEEVIQGLAHSTDLRIVSRLTTSAFKGRSLSAAEIGRYLNANYVLAGTFKFSECKLIVNCELAETRTGHIVWTYRYHTKRSNVCCGKFDFIPLIVSAISSVIVVRELRRARAQALPNLESYTLLLAAVALMHRLSLRDFNQAQQLLQALVDRAPREAIPLAWLAKWHVLRVQQGWSADPRREAAEALACTNRALDSDPDCSLALSIDGFVQTNLYKRLDRGLEQYDLAIQINPSRISRVAP